MSHGYISHIVADTVVHSYVNIPAREYQRQAYAKHVASRRFSPIYFDLKDVEAFYTDDYPVYNALKCLSSHETVNHSIGEYARSVAHNNTPEGEFSAFRPWNATFRGYSKENIHLCTAHHDFIRNNRHMDRIQNWQHSSQKRQHLSLSVKIRVFW